MTSRRRLGIPRGHPDDVRGSIGPATVPAQSFFAMGDNRDDSQDSRYLGFFPQRTSKGRRSSSTGRTRRGARSTATGAATRCGGSVRSSPTFSPAPAGYRGCSTRSDRRMLKLLIKLAVAALIANAAYRRRDRVSLTTIASRDAVAQTAQFGPDRSRAEIHRRVLMSWRRNTTCRSPTTGSRSGAPTNSHTIVDGALHPEGRPATRLPVSVAVHGPRRRVHGEGAEARLAGCRQCAPRRDGRRHRAGLEIAQPTPRVLEQPADCLRRSAARRLARGRVAGGSAVVALRVAFGVFADALERGAQRLEWSPRAWLSIVPALELRAHRCRAASSSRRSLRLLEQQSGPVLAPRGRSAGLPARRVPSMSSDSLCAVRSVLRRVFSPLAVFLEDRLPSWRAPGGDGRPRGAPARSRRRPRPEMRRPRPCRSR